MKTLLALLLFPLAAFSNNLFDSHETIKIKITAPFQTLFSKKNSHNLTELNSMIDGQLEVLNEYTQTLEIYDVQLKLRGNMTLHECDFPKLKLKFKKEQTTKKRLFNRKSYDLATHCVSDPTIYTSYLKSKMLSASPHRENFLFDVQRSLGIESPLTRNASITYVDNSAPDNIITHLNRDAFIRESTGGLIKRTNSLYSVIGTVDSSKKLLDIDPADTDLPPQRLFKSVAENPEVNAREVLKLILLQGLVGNMDYHIKTNKGPDQYAGAIQLWNIKAIALTQSQWTLFSNDFNLANVIAKDEFNAPFYATPAFKTSQIYFNAIGTTQDRQAVVDYYQSQRNQLYLKANEIQNDPDFKAKYLKYLDHFYTALDSSAPN